MTSRSFALSSLVAAIPGAAVATLIVMAILKHSGEIFASIPLAATLIVALICGVVVAIAPVVIFFRGRGTPDSSRLAPVPRPGGASGDVFLAEGSSDELAAAESSAVLAAVGGTSGEIFADENDEFSDDEALADSAEFEEAGSAEFEEEDDDPFADFDDSDSDADDDDSFFGQAPAGR